MTLIIVQGEDGDDYVEFFVCNIHAQEIGNAIAEFADKHKGCDEVRNTVLQDGEPAPALLSVPEAQPWSGIANMLLRSEDSRQELWENVLGSSGEEWDWWLAERYSNGADWDTIGEVTFTIENPDEPEGSGINPITKTLTISDIAEAYAKAIMAGYKVVPMNPEDGLDACSADVVLQFAVLGEVVYA